MRQAYVLVLPDAHVKNMDLILVTAHADATLGYDPFAYS